MTSDIAFLEQLLEQGEQTTSTILQACFAAGRPGMVVHSRVAELRARGVPVACERSPGDGRRATYTYRLVREAVAA